MAERRRIERTARVILAHQGHIVAMHGREDSFFHLPGGHLDAREDNETAVRREVQEELGIGMSNLRFLATIHNNWTTQPVHEVMALYAGMPESPIFRPIARESWLTAHLIPWHQAGRAGLQPKEALPYIAKHGNRM